MSTTFWIQFIGIIFGLVMVYFTFIKYKRNELKSGEALFWGASWILLILVAIIPSVLDPIIRPLNFHRRLDFFVVLGFFVLLALGFYNYNITKKLDKRMELLVRKNAIHKHKNKETTVEQNKEKEEQ